MLAATGGAAAGRAALLPGSALRLGEQAAERQAPGGPEKTATAQAVVAASWVAEPAEAAGASCFFSAAAAVVGRALAAVVVGRAALLSDSM